MSDDACILFPRGVTVGSDRKLPVAGLRALLQGMGLEGVKTPVPRGNAVFRDPARRADPGAPVSQAIGAAFPFTPEALVLDLPALEAVLAANPDAAEDAAEGGELSIGFLARPAEAGAAPLAALAEPGEGFTLTDPAFYLHAPEGIGRSKRAERAERLLKVPMTMRNQRVAGAVAALAREI